MNVLSKAAKTSDQLTEVARANGFLAMYNLLYYAIMVEGSEPARAFELASEILPGAKRKSE